MTPVDPIDLLLGSDIGAWIIELVEPAEVGTVITRDEAVARTAVARGMRVASGVAGVKPSRRAFSAHWPTVLSPADLATWEMAWNLHPGLLPWGRGYGPVFWALWAGEPAGASLHVMSSGLDRGAVVDQVQVPVEADDTGASLYGRVLDARRELVRRWWPRLVAGECPAGSSQPSGGSYHSRADLLLLRDHPDLDALGARDLARLCRALAMPGMPGPQVPGGRLTLVDG
jgi:folate-dependent phosphoribosylglycinamide formyltransferase PurN